MAERRPVPPLEPRERTYLEGLLRARERGRGKLPPPWVIAGRFDDRDDPDVLASVVAVHPIAPTANGVEEPWLIRGVLRRADDGPPTLTRLSVEHLHDPGAEVTGYMLDRIPVGRIRDAARAWLRAKEPTVSALLEGGFDVQPADQAWARRVAREATRRPPNRGPKGLPPDFYRGVALRAIELFDQGRRDVVDAIASERRKPYQTVRDWIRRCRSPELGFLAPTSQGRVDFRPGPNLYRKEK
jgi:hypothetical protein